MSATIIKIIHLLIIAFITITPFTNIPFLLERHIILVPFLWLHWITNNDTCSLTVLESYITDTKVTDTFIHKIIGPVYNISNTEIYICTFFLLCISYYKMMYIWNIL